MKNTGSIMLMFWFKMKSTGSILFILFFTAVSCNKPSHLSDLENGSIHGRVTDKTTGAAITDAIVYLQGYERSGSIISPGPTFTVATTGSDASGNFSFDFDYHEENGYFCSATADQYFDYNEEFVINSNVSGGGINAEVSLQPMAWLKVHCVNYSPYDFSDYFNMSWSFQGPFFGIEVDTIILSTAMGNMDNIITWYVTKNTSSQTYTDTLYCPSFDTTFYEILY